MGSGMAANTNSKAGIVAKLLEALSAFAHVCKRRIPTVIAVVLLLAVWEAWVRIGNVPSTMIAAPSEIAQATVETWSTLWPATQVTLLEGTVGFLFAVLFGILIGILLYCSCIANAALFPLLSAAQTMPLISIAPLFLIWFGFEISGKIVIVTVFGLFPIAVQTIRGLEAVPQFYSDVALTCGATKAWTLWHVKRVWPLVRFMAASAFPPHTFSPPPPPQNIWARAKVLAFGYRPPTTRSAHR